MRTLYGGITALLIMLTNPALADSDKRLGVNFLFNTDGFQGAGLFLGVDDYETHVAHTQDMGYATGLGYRVWDSEDEGLDGDKDESASVTLGGAYVSGANSGLRPFGQFNTEFNLGDTNEDSNAGVTNFNANLGLINYGLGLTAVSNGYGYVGLSIEHLIDNIPEPVVVEERELPEPPPVEEEPPVDNDPPPSDDEDDEEEDPPICPSGEDSGCEEEQPPIQCEGDICGPY